MQAFSVFLFNRFLAANLGWELPVGDSTAQCEVVSRGKAGSSRITSCAGPEELTTSGGTSTEGEYRGLDSRRSLASGDSTHAQPA
jgi:hypothetical protein